MDNIAGKKILIVEDDELLKKVYEFKLSMEGFSVVFAHDGDGIVEKIIAEKPDIVLLDLMLPKKDGFGILEDIQKIPTLSHIPIIALSNLGQQSDKDRALALGAREYLVKIEHSIQDVIDKVKGYLG